MTQVTQKHWVNHQLPKMTESLDESIPVNPADKVRPCWYPVWLMKSLKVSFRKPRIFNGMKSNSCKSLDYYPGNPCMASGFRHDRARFTISHSLKKSSPSVCGPHSNYSFRSPNESICKNVKGKIRSHFSYINSSVWYINIHQGLGNKFMSIGFFAEAEEIGGLRDWVSWYRLLPPLFLEKEGSV